MPPRKVPLSREYKGWAIYDNGPAYHPITGRWVAYRHGVRIGANTEELLIRMIDSRPY